MTLKWEDRIYTQKEAIKFLKSNGWTVTKGRWSTTKRPFKTHTQHGINLREACSLEILQTEKLNC